MKQAKGRGFWKMNCAILDDSCYIEEISNLLPKWVAEVQKNCLTIEASGNGQNLT